MKIETNTYTHTHGTATWLPGPKSSPTHTHGTATWLQRPKSSPLDLSITTERQTHCVQYIVKENKFARHCNRRGSTSSVACQHNLSSVQRQSLQKQEKNSGENRVEECHMCKHHVYDIRAQHVHCNATPTGYMCKRRQCKDHA